MSFTDNIYICDSVNIVKKCYLFSHESVKKKKKLVELNTLVKAITK